MAALSAPSTTPFKPLKSMAAGPRMYAPEPSGHATRYTPGATVSVHREGSARCADRLCSRMVHNQHCVAPFAVTKMQIVSNNYDSFCRASVELLPNQRQLHSRCQVGPTYATIKHCINRGSYAMVHSVWCSRCSHLVPLTTFPQAREMLPRTRSLDRRQRE